MHSKIAIYEYWVLHIRINEVRLDKGPTVHTLYWTPKELSLNVPIIGGKMYTILLEVQSVQILNYFTCQAPEVNNQLP